MERTTEGAGMAGWTADELDRLGREGELRIAGRRADDSLREPVIIWAVRAGGALYVRSVRGATGGWYRGVIARHEGHIDSAGIERDVRFEDVPVGDPVQDVLDRAYADKYGAGSSSVRAITADAARATTLKVVPR
ncbi:DUF2255 family protein [Amnibacterium sp. CER49]|uniref:DUF2255 family protein n=1 Tax=Amnibacterium sp. CER49 TaxID=3039161 RepID=UPI00244ACC6B|nr:DUF2255 family protein [Amnibacterium sp. CER49]MDH2442818.1 DUF2255 family protein [Amnibacterium sp. CER49]